MLGPFRSGPAASASRPPRPSITTTPHILERTVRGLQRTRVTALLEPGPEIGVVVDFAIVDDPHRPILVGHRLTASEYVHDREPAHPSPTGPPIHSPSPSGPRWRRTSRMHLRRASSTVSRAFSLMIPTI